MDQYPYSIPPGFHPYAGNAPEKNTDLPMGAAVPGQNPYYMHSGAAEVPPFGYVPPLAQEQQQVIQPNPVAIPSVHANGLMSSIPPAGHVGYSVYNNPASYGGQFPTTAVGVPMPPMAPLAGMYGGPQSLDPQGSLNPPSALYPTMPGVVTPAPVQPLGTVESNATGNAVPAEALATVQDDKRPAADPVESNASTNAEIPDGKDPEHEMHDTVQKIIEESNKGSTEHTDSTEATQASKFSEEPSQTTVNTDASELPATENDLPTGSEESNAHPDQPPQTSEAATPPSKSRSASPARSLSVSTEDVSTASVKKKRRRIVTLNDDEDSEDEDISNRMELLRSPEPPSTEGADADGEKSRHHSKDVDGSDGSERDEDDNDRPDSSVSGAVSIFQNVVMIPAGGDSEAHKRKKIRVLDSDDDEEDQKVLVSVDDIGLTGEGADDLNPGGLLVDENAENEDLGTVDGIELDNMEQIVAMDAPIIDPSEMVNEEDEEGGSDAGENEKETSDRERDGSERGEDEQDEELGEEEEIVEEGVEMIAAEDDDGEAIGIATDDEQELEENAEPEAASEEGEEDDNRGSDAEQEVASEEGEEDDNRGSDAEEGQASEAARSDAEEQSENEEQASESEKRDDSEEQEEEEEAQNDQSETRSSTPVEQEKESQESGTEQRKENDDGKKSDSDDDVVCQNDLELNTISLLTDEEDDNTTPLPPPKRELPVVRIVNIKKELLDDRMVRKEATARMDAATSYQQQHYLKKQKLLAQKKREKEKKKTTRSFDNNNPFGAWSSSSSDDEFIPNDIYFGTPDRVFTASTKDRCQRQKMLNDRYAKNSKPGRTPKRKYGEVPDAEQRKKQKQKLDEISRLNLPTYQQQQLQTMVKKKKKSRSDRFYDKSQDIPNDIYFGNVNVPLHILHSFADSSSDEDRRGGNVWRTTQPSSSSSRIAKNPSSSKSYKKPSSSSTYRSPHSPSNDRSVQAMKEYLKIAGFKNVKFHKLWEGCKSNQERANAILRLMQEKGLEGEPTIAKCRELRKQLQMEREAQVLDTSLIIESGGGRITRRSARNPQNQLSPGLPLDPNVPSTSGISQPPVVPPESLETLNRMRNVVDPDSDGEE